MAILMRKMARRHEEGRKTSTPKNSITDAPASFREELRLLKERIVHLETIVDKIDELEEKIEELIKRGMFIQCMILEIIALGLRLNP